MAQNEVFPLADYLIEQKASEEIELFLKKYKQHLEKSQIDLILFHKQHLFNFHLHSHIENEKFGKNPESNRIVTFKYGNEIAEGKLIIKFTIK